jgi:uncharacterized membrane protein YqhA
MKTLFNALNGVVRAIAYMVFGAGLVLTGLGIFDFIHAIAHVTHLDQEGIAGIIAIGMLQSVDMFLIAIVFFVFSLGVLILFNNKTEQALPANLPQWLKIKDFIQLKVILWEAILTTLLISYIAGLAEKRLHGVQLSVQNLIIPGAILCMALSLFFLKKGEGHGH